MTSAVSSRSRRGSHQRRKRCLAVSALLCGPDVSVAPKPRKCPRGVGRQPLDETGCSLRVYPGWTEDFSLGVLAPLGLSVGGVPAPGVADVCGAGASPGSGDLGGGDCDFGVLHAHTVYLVPTSVNQVSKKSEVPGDKESK